MSTKRKRIQLSMFTGGEDLPLFTGCALREVPAATSTPAIGVQLLLPETEPDHAVDPEHPR